MLARFICSTVLFAVVASAPGLAQEDEPDYARTGWYVGGGLAVGFPMFDSRFPTDVDPAVGIDFHGGYRATEFWGAELDLQYLNAFDVNQPSPGKIGDARTLDLSVNVMIYPLRGRIQPYVKVGLGAGWVQSDIPGLSVGSAWGTIFRGGGGIDYYLTEHIVLNVDAMVAVTMDDITGFNHVGLVFGGRYRF